MRHIAILPSRKLADAEGGYIARTISKGIMSSAPVTSWTQFYHKPYADDIREARVKAVNRCCGDALTYDGIIRKI